VSRCCDNFAKQETMCNVAEVGRVRNNAKLLAADAR
jgi:hypothetical protein